MREHFKRNYTLYSRIYHCLHMCYVAQLKSDLGPEVSCKSDIASPRLSLSGFEPQ